MSFRDNLNRKCKDKSLVAFRRKDMLLQVVFRVNLYRKRKDKLFLLFWRHDKSLQVSFRVNLNPKHKDKSILAFRRKHRSLQVSRLVNLNYRSTNRKPKDKLLKLYTGCKDKEYLLYNTLRQWLGCRKHQSYSIPHSAVHAVA